MLLVGKGEIVNRDLRLGRVATGNPPVVREGEGGTGDNPLGLGENGKGEVEDVPL